jgi:HPt (histidine-containing phosphotransfer) domain-containing protein
MGANTPGASPPVDVATLNRLYGEETVKELLEMSVKEARDLVGQITDAVGTRDSKAITAAAHQLKGLASTMTIGDLATVSYEIEQAARQEQWDAIKEKQKSLQKIFDDIDQFVTGFLRKEG